MPAVAPGITVNGSSGAVGVYRGDTVTVTTGGRQHRLGGALRGRGAEQQLLRLVLPEWDEDRWCRIRFICVPGESPSGLVRVPEVKKPAATPSRPPAGVVTVQQPIVEGERRLPPQTAPWIPGQRFRSTGWAARAAPRNGCGIFRAGATNAPGSIGWYLSGTRTRRPVDIYTASR